MYRVYFYTFDHSIYADSLETAKRIGRESGFTEYTIKPILYNDLLKALKAIPHDKDAR